MVARWKSAERERVRERIISDGSGGRRSLPGRIPGRMPTASGVQQSWCQVSGGTTGTVEVYHTHRLIIGAEELRAPLAGIVWDLVADFVADHRIG